MSATRPANRAVAPRRHQRGPIDPFRCSLSKSLCLLAPVPALIQTFPNRQPTESDAIDLQHTVLGLSHCDALVTERYAYSTAAYAIKALAPLPLATLHRKFGPDILKTARLAPAGGH